MPKSIDILQDILNQSVDNKKIFGTSFSLQYQNQIWSGSSGNLRHDSQYFIASTTKLFTTAVILALVSEKRLNPDDYIGKYLEDEITKDLHIFNGRDESKGITIRHLLAHTSGLPDYFQQKDTKGISLEKSILSGHDEFWSFEQVIERTKSLSPLFIPDTPEKAHYSDSNFQLLGKIIENITGSSISSNYEKYIFQPLQLQQTYLYHDIRDTRPQTMYHKNKKLHIPKAMTSFGPDGGIVSTSGEMITFIKAFFNGQLFPLSYIGQLQKWNKIFFPMQSGEGIHRFKLPWIFNPFGNFPELIGHSGLSGALAFCNPEKDIYISGTVNQIAYPDTSFRLAIRLIQKMMNQ